MNKLGLKRRVYVDGQLRFCNGWCNLITVTSRTQSGKQIPIVLNLCSSVLSSSPRTLAKQTKDGVLGTVQVPQYYNVCFLISVSQSRTENDGWVFIGFCGCCVCDVRHVRVIDFVSRRWHAQDMHHEIHKRTTKALSIGRP